MSKTLVSFRSKNGHIKCNKTKLHLPNINLKKSADCSCGIFSLITRSHNLICTMNLQEMNPRFIGTPKEKFSFFNTLLSLVKSLQGQYVTVDLRNDSYVCGLLLIVDGFMNLSFSTAVYCDPQGNEFYFESIFVQCRNIRYVQIPNHVSIINNIKNEVSREIRNKPTGRATDKSRKAKKAFNQHMQTVATLFKQ